MTFLKLLKCVFCLRWSCPDRYQIGNRTYYSHLGFITTECPKKKSQKDGYTDWINDQITKRQYEDLIKNKSDNKKNEG